MKNKNGRNIFNRQLSSAKSVGMIPISALPVSEDLTYKNWNKVEFKTQ